MKTRHADVAMLQGPKAKHVQAQKGNVLVEFALILPVFLLLLFGMVTFSIALYDKTVLTMATREGARAGAKYVANRTNTLTKSNATTAFTNASQNNLITFGAAMTPTVTFNADPITDQQLTITATVNYTGLYIFRSFSISAQSSMRLE
ncbi:MAG TPA: TadE/TadG family type IV pilus assembly protein [Chlorobaculum sp.]|nr:TadE/TadG family type IV pilus assembly protein [Chlorobaculum sp.]